ncbi:hypothetical protein K239x_53130 [Planctomycetes bacterium K23_9]|uniref:Uncharacterized protein n=1 Tax=Stieleria marina TaxID=1930275 RepID=A0A517P1Q9_9BACT|nr:hypothetical protein K239x_53130 [Planctomycetes bacterium K23_9]
MRRELAGEAAKRRLEDQSRYGTKRNSVTARDLSANGDICRFNRYDAYKAKRMPEIVT